jgi:hypothetical protein
MRYMSISKYLQCFFIFILGLFIMAGASPIQPEAFGFKGEVQQGGQEMSKADAGNKVYRQLNVIVAGITGLGALTLVAVFIKRVFEFGASAHNAQGRQKAMTGLLYVGIGFALLGGMSIFFAISAGLLG